MAGDPRNAKESPIRRIDRGNIDVAANLIPYLLLYLVFLSRKTRDFFKPAFLSIKVHSLNIQLSPVKVPYLFL